MSDQRETPGIESLQRTRVSSTFAHVSEFLSEPKPTEWTIKGILESGTVAQVFGQSTHGKSFIALDWACCVATGAAWHGHKVKPGPVFIVCGEGHAGLGRRFKAWEMASDAELSTAPIHITRQAIVLNEMGAAGALTAAVNQLSPHGPPALLIVDTMHRNFRGDENSSEAVGDFLRALEHFRHTWGCSIVVVHHTGHGDQDRARGSSALRPALDWDYRVSRTDDSVALSCQKAKDHAAPEPMYFRFEQLVLPWLDESGEPQSGAVLRPSDGPPLAPATSGLGDRQQRGLEALRRLYSDHRERLEKEGFDAEQAKVKVEDWKAACDFLKDPRKQFYKLKTSLESRQLIRVEVPYVYLV